MKYKIEFPGTDLVLNNTTKEIFDEYKKFLREEPYGPYRIRLTETGIFCHIELICCNPIHKKKDRPKIDLTNYEGI